MFTFKKEPKEAGLAAVACPYSQTHIKIRGKEVGQILPPHHLYGIESWRV